jgi:hypothetical protein
MLVYDQLQNALEIHILSKFNYMDQNPFWEVDSHS